MLIGGGIGLWILAKGGIAKAIASLTSTASQTAVDAAGGVFTGAVTGVSDVVGLPTPADVVNDARYARYIIDYPVIGGYYQASLWATPSALIQAAGMDAGSGIAPPAGTAVYAAFPPQQSQGGASGTW